MSGQLLFHRDFQAYSGGHGKVFDYFRHASAHPHWHPRIWFKAGASHPDNPWQQLPDVLEPEWRPDQATALFLAGIDWRSYPADDPQRPVLNLIQHVRHGDPASDVYPFLDRRAVRICVSQPVADAILATGRVNGPVQVIEAALDLPDLPAAREITSEVFIGAIKQPVLGRELSDRLRVRGLSVDLSIEPMPRANYLQRMGASRIAVLLPHDREGFYLPGLEAMALGCATVVPDCVGNRAYLRPSCNALVPAFALDELEAAVLRLQDTEIRRALAEAGQATARAFSMTRERQCFHAVLDELPLLWKA